jgi:hypothetical protein
MDRRAARRVEPAARAAAAEASESFFLTDGNLQSVEILPRNFLAFCREIAVGRLRAAARIGGEENQWNVIMNRYLLQSPGGPGLALTSVAPALE